MPSAKARSYKNQPFASFEKQSFSVLKDDFVHQKLLTVKANLDSNVGGVNLKESLSQKGQNLTSTGQTKLWFYFKNNYSLYTKILPSQLTLAYDHGVLEKNGKSFNWYGGVQSNRSFTNNHWKAGLEVFTSNWSVNNLLQWSQSDQTLLWLSKSNLTKDNLFVNCYKTIDLTGKAFKQLAFLTAYKKVGNKRNCDWTARFELDGFSNFEQLKNSLWGGNKLTLNWTHYQKGNWAHGLQYSSHLNKIGRTPAELLKQFTSAFEVQIPEQNSTFKLRLGGNWTAAVSLKHKLGSYGSYTWGAEISELGVKNHIRFGVQVDLNL